MADSLDEIETTLSQTTEITDDERAHERLEVARKELNALRERGDVDEDRADDLGTRIDQRLQAISERDSYGVDTMGAADNPDEDDAA